MTPESEKRMLELLGSIAADLKWFRQREERKAARMQDQADQLSQGFARPKSE